MNTKEDASKVRGGVILIEEQAHEMIAVSVTEMHEYGCPYCGYRSVYKRFSMGGTSRVECGECERSFYVLAEGHIKSNTVPPVKLQPHPRAGIPAHGRPDKRPEGGGEFFRSRGIGLDLCTCFICDTNDRTGNGHPYLNNIAAFVQCKAAGERVVDMFERGARLDFRKYEPDRVQVKIGACDKHLENLKELHRLTIEEGVITKEMIAIAHAVG
jgi:hypothetical protein